MIQFQKKVQKQMKPKIYRRKEKKREINKIEHKNNIKHQTRNSFLEKIYN